MRRHLPSLPQIDEVFFAQVGLQLLPEVLLLLSEEPAGHGKGEQVVLLDILVEDLLPQLGRQAP